VAGPPEFLHWVLSGYHGFCKDKDPSFFFFLSTPKATCFRRHLPPHLLREGRPGVPAKLPRLVSWTSHNTYRRPVLDKMLGNCRQTGARMIMICTMHGRGSTQEASEAVVIGF
jgi:hypothetical protein